MLRDHGLTAEPEGEVDIRIPCDDGAADGACDEILQHVESVVFDLGAPFIPQKHEGVIYVRPPLA